MANRILESKTFIEVLFQIADRFPDLNALHSEKEIISYFELKKRILLFSDKLKSKGAGPEIGIGIHLPRSNEYIEALLSVWASGSYFVPLEKNLTKERIDFIIQDSEVKFFISSKKLKYNYKKQNRKLDLKLIELPDRERLAYIIYTSGSTGEPRGVEITHRGIVNFLKAQIKSFGLKPGKKVLQVLPLGFDASISEIGIALLSGASLFVFSESETNSIQKILYLLNKYSITHACLPPAILSEIDLNQLPASLETVIIGGETCPEKTVREWAKKINLFNVYGPTEATVCTTIHKCSKNYKINTIGKPLPDTKIILVDEKGNISTKGEIWIGGVGLARGYRNQEEINRKKFIQFKKEKFYKSGDLAEINKKGELVFLGRVDRQIKLSGKRFEPEEVEAFLNSIPGIKGSSVFKEEKSGIPVSFIVPEGKIKIQDIKQSLKNKFPEWMIPKKILFLKSFPLNKNKKIDINNLSKKLIKSNYNRPETKTEKILFKIWQSAFGYKEIDVAESLENLGADSLIVLKILSGLDRAGFFIQPELLRTSSIKKLAKRISKSSFQKRNYIISIKELSEISSRYKIRENLKSDQFPEKVNRVLFTGGTGFFGSRLLLKFLESNLNVYAIVRGKSSLDAKDRLHTILKKVYYNDGQNFSFSESRFNYILKNLVVIKGDLEESKFGLSKNKYNILLKKIDSVVHSSAKVNYLDSLDELLKPNLISTKNILEFVFTKKRKYLFYISSLAIFAMGETHGKIDEKFPIEKSISICGGYAQSKWLCEKMIQDLLDKRGITIFRPGLISGDSRSGILNLSDSFSIFIEELMKLKSLPDFNFKKYYFDATPVDFVSDFAFIAFQIQSDKFQIYHLANPRPVSLQVVLDCLLKFGHAYSNSKVNPYFKMQENGLLNSFFGSSLNLNFRSPLEFFLVTNRRFSIQNSISLIAKIQKDYPKIDKIIIMKYLNYLKNNK